MDASSVTQIGLSLQSTPTPSQTQVGVAVARQALDMQKMQGALAIELIQSAVVEPVPALVGPGQTLHTIA